MALEFIDQMDRNAISRARTAAKRLGWRVERSRQRTEHLNNLGGLQLINENNMPIAGWDYELNPERVIALCPKPQYIYKTIVKKRGWSDRQIRELLGEPDKLVPSMHYRSGPRAQLYALNRVIEIEKAMDWSRSDQSRLSAKFSRTGCQLISIT
jgi:hypothetical protein